MPQGWFEVDAGRGCRRLGFAPSAASLSNTLLDRANVFTNAVTLRGEVSGNCLDELERVPLCGPHLCCCSRLRDPTTGFYTLAKLLHEDLIDAEIGQT